MSKIFLALNNKKPQTIHYSKRIRRQTSLNWDCTSTRFTGSFSHLYSRPVLKRGLGLSSHLTEVFTYILCSHKHILLILVLLWHSRKFSPNFPLLTAASIFNRDPNTNQISTSTSLTQKLTAIQICFPKSEKNFYHAWKQIPKKSWVTLRNKKNTLCWTYDCFLSWFAFHGLLSKNRCKW